MDHPRNGRAYAHQRPVWAVGSLHPRPLLSAAFRAILPTNHVPPGTARPVLHFTEAVGGTETASRLSERGCGRLDGDEARRSGTGGRILLIVNSAAGWRR